MTGKDRPTMLFRIESETNTNRFNGITVQPNLFGGHSVIRNWGRIGSSGQMQIDLYDNEHKAKDERDRILKFKRRRGYRHAIL